MFYSIVPVGEGLVKQGRWGIQFPIPRRQAWTRSLDQQRGTTSAVSHVKRWAGAHDTGRCPLACCAASWHGTHRPPLRRVQLRVFGTAGVAQRNTRDGPLRNGHTFKALLHGIDLRSIGPTFLREVGPYGVSLTTGAGDFPTRPGAAARSAAEMMTDPHCMAGRGPAKHTRQTTRALDMTRSWIRECRLGAKKALADQEECCVTGENERSWPLQRDQDNRGGREVQDGMKLARMLGDDRVHSHFLTG